MISEKQRQCELEKEARLAIEKSLRERINELEEQLREAHLASYRLRDESHIVTDSETEHKRILTEQEEVTLSLASMLRS